jgi:hypothetical protein
MIARPGRLIVQRQGRCDRVLAKQDKLIDREIEDVWIRAGPRNQDEKRHSASLPRSAPTSGFDDRVEATRATRL